MIISLVGLPFDPKNFSLLSGAMPTLQQVLKDKIDDARATLGLLELLLILAALIPWSPNLASFLGIGD